MTDYIFLGSLMAYNIGSFLFWIFQPALDFTEYAKYGLIGVIIVQNIIIFLLCFFLYKMKKNDPNVKLMEKMMQMIGGKNDE